MYGVRHLPSANLWSRRELPVSRCDVASFMKAPQGVHEPHAMIHGNISVRAQSVTS